VEPVDHGEQKRVLCTSRTRVSSARGAPSARGDPTTDSYLKGKYHHHQKTATTKKEERII
jgi:hypothetical protein